MTCFGCDAVDMEVVTVTDRPRAGGMRTAMEDMARMGDTGPPTTPQLRDHVSSCSLVARQWLTRRGQTPAVPAPYLEVLVLWTQPQRSS